MDILNILKTRKDEVVEKTLDHMPNAMRGDVCNVAFYLDQDNEGNIIVNHYPFLGQQSHPESVFLIIKEHERPDPDELGFESMEDVDWQACNYDVYLQTKIDEYIDKLEWAKVND
jgi:hypothetical protein